MLHKLLIAVAVLFSAFTLYAQRPVAAAVSDIEDDPANGLEMCRSLFNEYFLSELTTHAKINMLDTASIQKSVAELKLSRGRDLTEKEIKDLCAKLKTDALCLVKMSRGSEKAIKISVKIVDNTKAFSDVQAGDWFAPYVAWAASRGIMNGMGEGRFGPKGYFTKEQAVKTFVAMAEMLGIE